MKQVSTLCARNIRELTHWRLARMTRSDTP